MMNVLAMKQGLTQQQLQMVESEYQDKKKDRTVMLVLWLFFAGFGGHRFYIGDKGYAMAMLFLGWATAFIWPLIDIIFAWKRIEVVNENTQEQIITRVKMFNYGQQPQHSYQQPEIQQPKAQPQPEVISLETTDKKEV